MDTPSSAMSLSLAAITAICFLLSGGVDACMTIVKVKDITPSKPFTMRFWTGHKICLEDEAGRRAQLDIGKIVWRRRYELAYNTADYDVQVQTVAGECCQDARCSGRYPANPSPCFKRTEAKALAHPHIKQAPNWGCIEEANKTVPYFARKALTRKGTVYGVLQHLDESAIVSLKLNVVGPNKSHEITFVENQPRQELDLSKVNLKGALVPIKLQPAPPQGDRGAPKSYLRDGDKYYFAYASEAGKPARYTYRSVFGEYQISLKDGKETYEETVVAKCKIVNECDSECVHTEPSTVSHLEKHKGEYQQPTNFTVSKDGSVLEELYETYDGTELQVVMGV